MTVRLLNISSSIKERRCKVSSERNLENKCLRTDFDGFRITFSTASFGDGSEGEVRQYQQQKLGKLMKDWRR